MFKWIKVFTVAIISFIVIWNSSQLVLAASYEETIQPPSQDTLVKAGYGGTQCDGTTAMIACWDRSTYMRRGILKFELPELPETANLTSAIMYLYYDYWEEAKTDPYGKKVYAYRLTRETWLEGITEDPSTEGATWNDYRIDGEVHSEWTTGGGDYTETNGAYVTIPDNEDVWLEWDVTDIVQYQLDEDIDADFLLRFETEGLPSGYSYVYFRSKENEYGEQYDPKLVITCSLPDVVLPPSDFVLSDLGGITVSANWIMGLSSNYTMLRVGREDYPTSIDSDELIYYGSNTSANMSGFSLDTTTYYFSAWGFASDNVTYSGTYVTAQIGGEGMEGIADQLTAFNGIVDFLSANIFRLFLLIGILALAFWKNDSIIYLIAGILTILISVEWFEDYPGPTAILWALAVYLIGFKGVISLLQSLGSARGLSQFKNLWHRGKG